jgi:hypothetical protein
MTLLVMWSHILYISLFNESVLLKMFVLTCCSLFLQRHTLL